MFVIAALSADAQKKAMMGKIVDEHGKNVKDAALVLVKGLLHVDATVTPDGYYYTDPLFSGEYTVYIQVAHVTYSCASKIKIDDREHTAVFYNFSVAHRKAILNMTENDPFTERALEKARTRPAIHVY